MAENKAFKKSSIERRNLNIPFTDFEAGLVLTGTEVKAMRQGLPISLMPIAYLTIQIYWLKICFIAEYDHGTVYNPRCTER